MKKTVALVLSLVCIFGLIGCKNANEHNDFYDYEDDCNEVVQFVLGYDVSNIINDTISAFTIDINEGYIKIDDSYQSTDNLTNSIDKLREKGFTYIEVTKNYLIFWEDNGHYGWLWSNDPVGALNDMTEGDRPYIKSQKITDSWYEVRVWGSF